MLLPRCKVLHFAKNAWIEIPASFTEWSGTEDRVMSFWIYEAIAVSQCNRFEVDDTVYRLEIVYTQPFYTQTDIFDDIRNGIVCHNETLISSTIGFVCDRIFACTLLI